MEHVPTREEIAEWLVRTRGKKALVTFAKELGISKSALINYESGDRVPPTETYLRWRATYTNFPGRTVTNATFLAEPRGDYVSEYVEVPLYDIAAATGPGKWNETERVKTYLQFRRDWLMWTCGTTAGLSLITAEGDSMVKTIPSGAVVLVRELPSWNLSEGIYFMRLRGRHVLKRVKPVGFEGAGPGALAFKATVCSDTDDQGRYPPEDVTFVEDMSQENDIFARAVWVGYKLP